MVKEMKNDFTTMAISIYLFSPTFENCLHQFALLLTPKAIVYIKANAVI